MDCNRYSMHTVETYSLSCQTGNGYLRINWVSDYVMALRSGQVLIVAAILFFKDNHVYGNRFKVIWCFNWHAQTESLFLMTSCAFGCYMLYIWIHSNTSSVTSTRAGEIPFRWAHLWWPDFYMHPLVKAALASIHFGKGNLFEWISPHVKVFGCCLNWHEEYVRNMCAILVKIQEVGSWSHAQLEKGHVMGWWLINLWWRAQLCQFEKCCS